MFVHWRAKSALARLLMDAPADRLFAICYAFGLARIPVCLIFLRQPAAFVLTLASPLPYPCPTLTLPCPAMLLPMSWPFLLCPLCPSLPFFPLRPPAHAVALRGTSPLTHY